MKIQLKWRATHYTAFYFGFLPQALFGAVNGAKEILYKDWTEHPPPAGTRFKDSQFSVDGRDFSVTFTLGRKEPLDDGAFIQYLEILDIR